MQEKQMCYNDNKTIYRSNHINYDAHKEHTHAKQNRHLLMFNNRQSLTLTGNVAL